MLKKVLRWLRHPSVFILTLENHGLLQWINDEIALKFIYYFETGRRLNLENPKTFNEKLQWLKLNDRKELYTKLVDKLLVKQYVKERIGEQYVIPTYAVWNKVSEIDYDKLPEQFVLKTNHNSGGVVVCKDKSKLDKKFVARKLRKSLRTSGYWPGREYQYKNVKRLIFAEELMTNATNEILVVYKFFCFNGEPYLIQVIQDDKTPNETIDYFDLDWNLLDLRQNYPSSIKHLPRPQQLEQMIDLCRKLRIDVPFVRIDLYLANGQIYFSEYTFHSDNGFSLFEPDEWDTKLGDMIDISSIKKSKSNSSYKNH